MPDSLAMTVQGRGVRTFDADAPIYLSRAGEAPPVWCSAKDARPGDWLGISYGGDWSSSASRVPGLPRRPLRGSEKAIRIPGRMTDDLALFLGAYLSEGHTTRSNWSVIFTNSVPSVLKQIQQAAATVFGLESRLTHQADRCPGLVVSSKRLVEFMEQLECGSRASNKGVPDLILDGRREHAIRFMQGAALDAYTSHVYAGKWAICLESRAAIDGLQDLVTKLGIVNAQIPKFNKLMQKTYYELYAAGPWGQEMSRQVTFLEPDKKLRAEEYRNRAYRTALTDRIPGILGRELFGLVPAGLGGRSGKGTGRQAFRHLCDSRSHHVTRESVRRARASGAHLPTWLHLILDEGIRFAPVVAVVARDGARCESATSPPPRAGRG